MLIANGDCLMATVLAKQIKKDYPGCHLTWAISNLCRPVINNNPDVDAIWEIPLSDKKDGEREGWFSFAKQAEKKKANGEFDEIFLIQIYPSNVHNYDGTTRSTIYNAYPHAVTVDARPVLRLTAQEVINVKQFADQHRLHSYRHVILLECSSFSGQSFVSPEWAIEVAKQLLAAFDDLFVIVSTHLQLSTTHPRMATASQLTLRENAELTKYCTLLIGCSSGITWISTTDWAKRLPMIQFLKRGIGFTFASVAYDHKYWGLDISEIIETTKSDTSYAVILISNVLKSGIEKNKVQYHEVLRPRIRSLFKYAFMFFRKGQWKRAARLVRNYWRRNF